MELGSYWHALRKQWPTMALVLLFFIGIGVAYLALTPTQYVARTQAFLTSQGPDQAQYDSAVLDQQRARSYVQAVTGQAVLKPVIDELGLSESVDQLGRRVDAYAQTGTVIVTIEVRDTDPGRAAATANAVTGQFRQVVDRLEREGGGTGDQIEIIPIGDAEAPTTPDSPDRSTSLVSAGLLGLLVGSAAAVSRYLLQTTLRTREDVRRITPAAVVAEFARPRRAGGRATWRKDVADSAAAVQQAIRFSVVRPLRSIAICPATTTPGTAQWVAAALAESLHRVGEGACLFDADLTSPNGSGDTSQRSQQEGLSEVLTGRARLDDVLLGGDTSGPTRLGPGLPTSNPETLLGSTSLPEVIEALGTRFDRIVLAAGPTVEAGDGLRLARAADGVLVVVELGTTTQQELRSSMTGVAGAGIPLLGLVLVGGPRARGGGLR